MTFMKNFFQGDSVPSISFLFSEVVLLPTTYEVLAEVTEVTKKFCGFYIFSFASFNPRKVKAL